MVESSSSPVAVARRKRPLRDKDDNPKSSSPVRKDPPSSLPPLSEPDFDDRDIIAPMDEPFDDVQDEDEEGEDLFAGDILADYKENEALDRYEDVDMDEDGYDMMDPELRQLAEAKMKRRDKEEARREGRLPAAYLDDDEEDEDVPLRIRRRHLLDEERDMELDPNDEMAMQLPLESLQEIKGPLSEWVQMEGPRQTIRSEFANFLTTYVDEKGLSVYGERIRAMCEANGESLEVSFMHLRDTSAILAYYLSNSPAEILDIFNQVAYDVVLSGFEEYGLIKSEVHVRISEVPIVDSLRDLKQTHLNSLVRVGGVVTRRTGVFPQLKYVRYDCVKCGHILGPFIQDLSQEIKLGSCPECQSKGPFSINNEETVYRNYQKITLQESPGSVPAGRLPRHKEVILLWDLVDSVRPGEEIEITGIYRNNFDMSLNTKNGFPVFSTIIEANHISKKEDMYASFRLTEDDVREIRQLARDPRIRQRIIQSIAPSIFGHENIKTALALAMFGGVFKNPQGKHRIRGDINVLLLGDPGTAKSQFLKYVEKTMHRAVYTTGQGASAVGLTAAVHKDPVTKEWTLEGGALVMADKGVCMIDEFDKMNDKDRTSIHEAMEQQSISISKAGIVTSLQARCAVIAAANPTRGRYNAQIPFSQNVELTEPILSRFDILCVVQDLVDPVVDEQLARFVVESHNRSHPDTRAAIRKQQQEAPNEPIAEQPKEQNPDIIPQELLKKYIMFAKENVVPRIADMDKDKIASLYSDLRRESLIGGSIPITVRHIESIVRMSEAFARMHLRDVVRHDDIERACAVMIRSFVTAQKYSVRKPLERAFNRYLRYDRDNFELLNHVLSRLVQDKIKLAYYRSFALPNVVEIKIEELEAKARELNVHDLRSYYDSRGFKSVFTLDRGRKVIRKIIDEGGPDEMDL